MNDHDFTMTFDDATANGGSPLVISLEIGKSNYLSADITISGLVHPLYLGHSSNIGMDVKNTQLKDALDQIIVTVNKWSTTIPRDLVEKYRIRYSSFEHTGPDTMVARIDSKEIAAQSTGTFLGMSFYKTGRARFHEAMDTLAGTLVEHQEAIIRCIKVGQLNYLLYDPTNEFHRDFMRPSSSVGVGQRSAPFSGGSVPYSGGGRGSPEPQKH